MRKPSPCSIQILSQILNIFLFWKWPDGGEKETSTPSLLLSSSPPAPDSLLLFNLNFWMLISFSCLTAGAAAKSLQSCPTLCDPRDGSPLGSSVPGILQARILEWVAISFSNAWKWKVTVKSLSRARLSATPRTAAYQAPPSMGFSRQEYWSGVPLPSPLRY